MPEHSRVRSARLTGRQKQILDLLSQNLSSKEVAERLRIHRRTVDNHCVNIIKALGVVDRYDAVRVWSQLNRLEPERRFPTD
ncbi:MAG: helix-turn-helix transcriptional regulator [Coriobacteriales bacterium]|nr:helix-turn-helix transcriptional regulator [Coriobacteriales bacterium]